MPTEPLLTFRNEGGHRLPMLVWRLSEPCHAIGSAPLGGGIGPRHWLINATVPMSYRRNDPDHHLAELAHDLDLVGTGIGLLTGVDVAEVVARTGEGVRIWATVGLGAPVWAAADTSPGIRAEVGTINIVVHLPARLSDAAMVNAVATVTEAKAQALWELGLPATGTATDSVVVLCPPSGPAEPYGGPRSRWGAPLARATRAAVLAGGADPRPAWSTRHGRPSNHPGRARITPGSQPELPGDQPELPRGVERNRTNG